VKPSTERDGSLNGLKNFQENYCDSFNFVDLRSCVSKRGSTLLLTSFNFVDLRSCVSKRGSTLLLASFFFQTVF